MKQQYRGVGVEWHGYVIARVRDNRTGRVLGIYHRLGRWRVYGTDDPAPKSAARCAARLCKDADINELHQAMKVRVSEAAGRARRRRR